MKKILFTTLAVLGIALGGIHLAAPAAHAAPNHGETGTGGEGSGST